MLFNGTANPTQLKMLTSALDKYCQNQNIQTGTPEHEEAGRLVMALFNNGLATPEQLWTALHSQGRDWKHPGQGSIVSTRPSQDTTGKSWRPAG